MRVTGGQWRGRRLDAVRGTGARPSTDRVREALFGQLGPLLPGAEVADLCCGSGALGIEALSRGASHAHFVDLSRAALATTAGNLAALGAASERYAVHRADAARWLVRWAANPGPPLLVLADPPYGGPAAAQLAAAVQALDPARILAVAFEHGEREDPLAAAGAAWRSRRRAYGGSALTLLHPRDGD